MDDRVVGRNLTLISGAAFGRLSRGMFGLREGFLPLHSVADIVTMMVMVPFMGAPFGIAWTRVLLWEAELA